MAARYEVDVRDPSARTTRVDQTTGMAGAKYETQTISGDVQEALDIRMQFRRNCIAKWK
jgi:hypothetical protein